MPGSLALLLAVHAAATAASSMPPPPPPSSRFSLSLLIDRLRMRDARPWDDDSQETIGRLIELNRQLQRERAEYYAAARRAWRYAPPRMICVANRLPLSVKRGEDGRNMDVLRLRAPPARRRRTLWS